jgi:hypothetical protein
MPRQTIPITADLAIMNSPQIYLSDTAADTLILGLSLSYSYSNDPLAF